MGALWSGTRVGPYQILGVIGGGGMGDVYRARDSRLDRIVALKVSKEEFTPRFETEARATAALEHPHICRLYDVCHEDGVSFLVMEYVEGTPLAGPLPLERVLTYAGQIAGALDEAHRKQIVHRDLKPSNILVTKSGVKLLDFGLAKLGRADTPLDDAALTRGITAAGTILGTLHYMSPEQLQGSPADSRSDIFAFGLVLYEMLTGKRAFDGASAASIIAAILERPAPSVADIAPSSLDRLIKRCLAKDPDERWQSARDIRAALDLIVEPAIPTPAPVRKTPTDSWWPWLVAGALAAGLAAISVIHFGETTPAGRVMRFQIPAPDGTTIVSAPLLSPDGRSIAFVASGQDGSRAVWVRAADALQARRLAGTEDVGENVFWSADSRFIAFAADGNLRTIEVAGGASRAIAANVGNFGGGSWNGDGEIIFSNFARGVFRVAAGGGTPVQLTTIGTDQIHVAPSFLPDGRRFVYLAITRDGTAEARLASLDSPETQRLPIDEGSRVLYAPPQAGERNGRLLYARGDTLMAQPVDDATFARAGEAVVLAENLGGADFQPGLFSVSTSGALAYLTGDAWRVSRLTWFDRRGRVIGVVGPDARYNDLSLSPDDTRVAVTRREGDNDDIWIVDLARNAPARFTTDAAQDWHPVWSPDATRLAFSSTRPAGRRANNLFWKAAANVGAEEPIVKPAANQNLRVNDWSPDGKLLLVFTSQGRGDLLVVPVTVNGSMEERTLLPFIRSQFAETRGQFFPSERPDGRYWIAYASNESGRSEIYVESFPRGAPKATISTSGGMQPRWRRDGKELFYLSVDRKLMAVDVTVGETLQFGVPKELFRTSLSTGSTIISRVLRYDVTRDGQRFLINTELDSDAGGSSEPITVVLNWHSLLNR